MPININGNLSLSGNLQITNSGAVVTPPVGAGVDRTDDRYWEFELPSDYTWTGKEWVSFDSGDIANVLEVKSGTTWADGYRPHSMVITLSNHIWIPGSSLSDLRIYVYDTDDNQIAFVDDSPWDNFQESRTVVVPLTFEGFDIDRISLNTYLYNLSPLITKIEFYDDAPPVPVQPEYLERTSYIFWYSDDFEWNDAETRWEDSDFSGSQTKTLEIPPFPTADWTTPPALIAEYMLTISEVEITFNTAPEYVANGGNFSEVEVELFDKDDVLIDSIEVYPTGYNEEHIVTFTGLGLDATSTSERLASIKFNSFLYSDGPYVTSIKVKR